MRRYIRYEPFDIYCFEASEWQHPVHKHTYFEIIFIKSGNGKHFVNGNTLHYERGDVFLLGPEDYHSFNIHTTTEFVYIRFTESFINDSSTHKHKAWQQTINALLTTAYHSDGNILKSEEEKKMLDHLLAVLVHEYQNRHEGSSYEMIVDGIMKAMVSILARNIISQAKSEAASSKTPQLIESMLIYIRQNIHQPEQLRMEILAERFHYSPSYLSAFFKKQVGEPLQQYILKFRLKLVENRLINSSMTISEICHEFGFTDESHLNKVFRKYYGKAPGVFRKNTNSN